MSLFAGALYPGRALGFLVLGATLHDIITRLKAEPQTFPKLDLIFSSSDPVTDAVILNLPNNGIRLRFDGPEQRLRLIEVLEFNKSKLTYNNIEIIKAAGVTSPGLAAAETSSGPNFRHVYHRLLGPTFPGEYIPPEAEDSDSGYGLYVLSYPGVAFSFPMQDSAWSPQKAEDYAALLSSSAAKPAVSMAIFNGESWADARAALYTRPVEDPRTFPPFAKLRDTYAPEISLVKILGEGRLEMERPWASSSFFLTLGQTTPQELVAELGPPDAVYRKSDQRMQIHKARTGSETRATRPSGIDARLQDDSTDTDQSSAHTTTDASEDESDGEVKAGQLTGECFYNYFYHGFDILITAPTAPSRRPPSLEATSDPQPQAINATASTPLVATKIILHSNVPGSYSFNRHRRCRWTISYLSSSDSASDDSSDDITSETPFRTTASRLSNEWASIYSSPEEAKQRQRGMVLNRGWGDSPGSSVELLGGWEDSAGGKRVDASGAGVAEAEQGGLGNTTLFGFPGLVFEVLKNGVVSGLTVF